ncbi:MAG: LPS assembly protein LptD [Steroidobacteraceae bacterium]
MPTLRHPAAIAVTLFAAAAAQTPLAAAEPGPAAARETPATLPMCPRDRALNPTPPPAPLGPALAVSHGVTVEGEGAFRFEADGRLHMKDHVVVRQGERRLSADELFMDTQQNHARVSGAVEYQDPGLRVRGEDGDFQNGAARITGAQFELPQQPARGAAQLLELNQNGRLRLEGVSYTTCPPERSDWQIEAGSVTIDTQTNTGVARDARLRFLGVPILRLPWLSFPVGSARKTGFLFPSIGSSSRSGLLLAAPYYFNIAPNLDATFTPTVYTLRGLDLGGEFRYLFAGSEGQLLANLLPGDDSYGATRSRLRLQNVTGLPGNWRLTLDGENVGDPQYFEDFSQGTDGASIAFLPRLAHLSYRDPQLRMGVLARNFQTIDQALLPADRPYTEIPRAYADGNWRTNTLLPLEYGFQSELTGFRRGVGVDGWRLNVAPQVGLDVAGPGYFLRPSLAFQATAYRLSNAGAGSDRSPSRSLPLASIDGGLLFERSVGSRGQRVLTFEPRAMYLYVPYRNQDGLPVFDTSEPDLNWVELFRSNRYVGLDRVSDANQIAVGFTTRLFNAASGTRYLAATLGQAFHFQSPRVRLPDEPVTARNSSDLIAQLELKAFEDWNVDLGLQWNPDESQAERSEVRLQYRPDSQHVANFGYRFQRDRLKQADVSVAWPVAKQWNVYGRMLYSLDEHQAIEAFAGFEYSSCCWGVRAVAREYVSRRSGDHDRGIYVQLELKGLSSVGLAADAFLERAIRGYSADPRRR